MRILLFCSGIDGCWFFRVKVPMQALEAHGVQWVSYQLFPYKYNKDRFAQLVNIVKNFDLVILQRMYIKAFADPVIEVCEFLGKPVIFETDDDYLNLIPSNPCYFSLADQTLFSKYHKFLQAGDAKSAQEMVPQLLESKAIETENYKQLLRSVDAVTVSTPELKQAIAPYNKVIEVFPNNLQHVYPWREDSFVFADPNERVSIPNEHKLYIFSAPNHISTRDGTTVKRLVRVGYTGTPSHRQDDFNTIKPALNRFCRQFKNQALMVWMGDPWFAEQLEHAKDMSFHIPTLPYDHYICNIRNIDVGLAPLFPNEFNMSKSEIKALEYASWGIPSVLPNYVTYTRAFTDGVNCLTYNNMEEFGQKLELIVKDHDLREKLGVASLQLASQRIESNYSKKRYDFYKSMIDNSYPLKIFEAENK